MAINKITCDGVTVEILEDGSIMIEEFLTLSCEAVHGLCEALGQLGFDLSKYTLPEVAGNNSKDGT